MTIITDSNETLYIVSNVDLGSDPEIYSSVYSSDEIDEEEPNSPATPVKILNVHDIIIATAKAMGYTSNEDGVCNGIVSMGMRSAILEKHAFFNTRIEHNVRAFSLPLGASLAHKDKI